MPPTRLFQALVRASAAAVLTSALTGTALLTAMPAAAAPRTPATPSGLPVAIEAAPAYVPATSCDPRAKPGSVALGKLLTRTYPGTTYGISRSCGSDPRPSSEHYEGRAVDWMVSVRNKQQAAQAKALLAWLQAPDAAGNANANARRLGVMYVIWDDEIWSTSSTQRRWRPYRNCADHPEKSWDGTCHRNHVHFSLSWTGAMRTTSYWTKKVAVPDFGPCRPRDLNWAAPRTRANPKPCPRYPRVSAPAGASANVKALYAYSGQRLVPGSTGTAVVAVQRALRVRPTGNYLSLTKAAVIRFQSANRLRTTGTMNHATWRALLAKQTR